MSMKRMIIFSGWTAVFVFALSVPGTASAATITLDSLRDAAIYENNVDNSNGAGPALFAGTNGMNSPRRGLIGFDIAGNIPAGATIDSVQLTLFLAQVAGSGAGGSGDPTPRTIELHALTADWGEGTTGSGSGVGGSGQGFPANPGDATWNARLFPATLWTTPGGDFSASASASALVTNVVNAPYVWLTTSTLVNDVHGWLDNPSSNFGWAVINAEETTPTDFRAFYTHDFSDAALHPQLEIEYTEAAVPEPASLALLSLGLTGVLARHARRRRVAARHSEAG